MLKLVVVAIMLLTSIVSANEAFEFQGFDAWYLQQKDWVKTDNTLSWPHVSWAEARLGEFQWTDYDLTFTVVPEEYGKDGEVRLYFRQTKPFPHIRSAYQRRRHFREPFRFNCRELQNSGTSRWCRSKAGAKKQRSGLFVRKAIFMCI